MLISLILREFDLSSYSSGGGGEEGKKGWKGMDKKEGWEGSG